MTARPPFDYSPISERPEIEWPNGARVAFWIGLNIEHYEVDKPSTSIFGGTAGLAPDALNYGWRDYGVRVGVWRMAELFDKYGMRASVMLNSDVCHEYPQIIEAGKQRDWAWVAHGKNNSMFQTGMDEETERGFLTDITDTIRDATGSPPRGWLGPALTETFNTPNLLAELGYDYDCNWCNDDQPYPMNVREGRLVALPYSIEVNDIPLLNDKGLTGEQFADTVIDQFDWLYREGDTSGRVMGIGLHPFLVGLPFRMKHLERILSHISDHDDVWLTTSDEIASWYLEHHMDG